MGLGRVRSKKPFAETTIHKIFDRNSSFHVKQLTTGKVEFLFFQRILQLITKLLFRGGRGVGEETALGNNSMKFYDFLIFTNFLRY